MKRDTAKQKLTLSIDCDAMQKMVALVATNQMEVGWYGVIEQLTDNTFSMVDVLVPPQYVTGASIDSDDVEYMEWRDEIDDYAFRRMRCFGHSHVNMDVFSSSVDDAKQKETIQAFSKVNCKYFFLIVNKRFEYWCKAVNPSTGIWYDVEIPNMDKYIQWSEEENKKVRPSVTDRTNRTTYFTGHDYMSDEEFQRVFGEMLTDEYLEALEEDYYYE